MVKGNVFINFSGCEMKKGCDELSLSRSVE